MKKLILILLTVLSLVANAQTKQSAMEQKSYTIIVLMNATPKWLSLTDFRQNFQTKK